jgi:three-Cys-motif partner protein
VEAGPDGLPVQCVGPQAKDKHHYVRQYIEATHAVRRKFLERKTGREPGGAAYIDLFAGPGRARIRTNGEIIDGTPLLALQHEKAPFSRVILCDLDEESVAALRKRAPGQEARTEILLGDCNKLISKVVSFIPPYGLNFAFVDPFGLDIEFETLLALARISRMDMLIHFSTQGFKRNIHQGSARRVEKAFGTSTGRLKKPADFAKAIEEFRADLVPLGYTGEQVRSVPILNTAGATLYHLVFVSKDPRGDKIWSSITKTTAKGQRRFSF